MMGLAWSEVRWRAASGVGGAALLMVVAAHCAANAAPMPTRALVAVQGLIAADAAPGDVGAKVVLAQAAPKARQGRAAPAAPADKGDAGLLKRIEQLEEQLIDMQVVLGTLQSLAQAPRGAPTASSTLPQIGGGGTDPARVESLEAQVRALTQQVERMQQEGAGGGQAVVMAPREESAPAASAGWSQGSLPRGTVGGFGQTTVTPTARDPIGGLIARNDPGGQMPSVPQADPANAKQAYEVAYGYLLQQNYAAAERGFSAFLARYPDDGLSGNAQYWLGETHYVRGDYRAAAGAFLKGYQTYARSPKAPESLLKLAMSLERLGQRETACATLGELDARFPQAASHVRSKAAGERRRAGC